MKKLLIIFTFIIPGFISAQKVKPAQFIETKIPAKNLRFRNDQFTFDSTILKDTFTISWFQNTETWKKLFPGTELFNPGDEWKISNHFIPSATRFSNKVIRDFIYDSDSLLFRVTELNAEQLNLLNLPFYFKNVEVTNGEYREFIRYVRDSIARKLLANVFPEKYYKLPKDFKGDPADINPPLNWDVEFKYYDPELMPILAPMYFPDHERFYWRRMFDPSKLIYKYYVNDPGYYDIPGKEIRGNVTPHSINIAPDSIRWIKDFSSPYLDPYFRNYQWHEAYDDYPVVGITYEQAKAFCIWKTDQLKKKMAKLKLPFTFEVGLPLEHEWEYVLSKVDYKTSRELDGSFKYEIPLINVDFDWKTNILFEWKNKFTDWKNTDTIKTDSTSKIITYKNDSRFIYEDNELSGFYKIIHFGPFTLKSEWDEFDVNYWSLANNVSEWMDEDFTNGYDHFWNLRVAAFKESEDSTAVRVFKSELNNYAKNASNIKISQSGKLVRGSNWFDREQPDNLGFSMAKAQKKAFLPSDSKHCTLGFRYVIRLKPIY